MSGIIIIIVFVAAVCSNKARIVGGWVQQGVVVRASVRIQSKLLGIGWGGGVP